MTIDKATVDKIANLAQISIPEGDKELLAKQLSNILGFFEQLNEVNTDGVEPMTTAAKMKLPRRKDVVTDGGQAQDLLLNGPEVTGDFFVVPKVVE